MAEPKSFMDRLMARTSQEMIYESAWFVRRLANRLGGGQLSIQVDASDVAEHYGEAVGFLQAALALSQMTRCRFTFEKNGRFTDCPLISTVEYDVNEQIMQLRFTQQGRDLLQDFSYEWTLRIKPLKV